MGTEARATAAEAFDLTLATAPQQAGATVTLEALYGIDGVDTGTDAASADLVFPVAMDEGAPGAYSAEVVLHSTGVFWAQFHINGTFFATIVVRVQSDGFPAADARTDTPFTLGLVAPTSPTSITLSLFDDEGASAGLQLDGTAYVWPLAMTVVPSHGDSFYFADITFDEGGRIQAVFDPSSGPLSDDIITVDQGVQSFTLQHFSGWEPDAGFVPVDWVPLSYIRRWTGWSVEAVGDAVVKELRRTAIETFIGETNTWLPQWAGTWHSLRAQGSKLYLPVPILLPREGGIEPVVSYTRPEGDQDVVQTLDNRDLVWRVRGRDTKQPYVEIISQWWDHTLDVKIAATWGSVGPNQTTPIKLRQVMVGLMRWHALSFGVDADDARDQSTLNRITSEGSRDMRVAYDERAIGAGLTGDRTIDRALAEFTVQPGPWIRRGGDTPDSGRLGLRRRSI